MAASEISSQKDVLLLCNGDVAKAHAENIKEKLSNEVPNIGKVDIEEKKVQNMFIEEQENIVQNLPFLSQDGLIDFYNLCKEKPLQKVFQIHKIYRGEYMNARFSREYVSAQLIAICNYLECEELYEGGFHVHVHTLELLRPYMQVLEMLDNGIRYTNYTVIGVIFSDGYCHSENVLYELDSTEEYPAHYLLELDNKQENVSHYLITTHASI